MSTREIRTSTATASCDVCGRTLLRGERAEIYVQGGARRSVCELCTARALHGGWVREGTVPEYDAGAERPDGRRSLLRRRRARREPERELEPVEDAFEDGEPRSEESEVDWHEMQRLRAPERRGGVRRHPAPRDDDGARGPRSTRETRHVRAVPTSVEHKTASAVSLFNASEHPRTVAGIARSLGLPDVSVHPVDPVASLVAVVLAWELCWYRYEVDLSDEVPTVRKAAQGYELDELSALARQLNAAADDRGRLSLAD